MKEDITSHNQDELEAFLAGAKASTPRETFKTQLLEQLEVYAEQNSPAKSSFVATFISYISLFMKRNMLFALLAVIVAAGAITGGVYLATREAEDDQQEERTAEQPTNENTLNGEALQSIFAKNPSFGAGIGAGANSAALNTRAVFESFDQDIFDYNFAETTQIISFGDAVDQCVLPHISPETAERVTYTYTGTDGFLFKEEQRAADNTVIAVIVTNEDGMTYYFGGDYAARQELSLFDAAFTEMAGDFVSDLNMLNTELEAVDEIFSSLGLNDVVVETEENSDIVLTGETVGPCGNDTLIFETIIDGETYEIITENYYVDEISDDTLVYALSSTTTYSSVDKAEVEEDFAFDTDVRIETLEDIAIDIDTEAVLNFITDNNIDIITLDNGAYELGDAAIAEQASRTIFDVFADRDFYVDNETGDALFEHYSTLYGIGDAEADLSLTYYGEDLAGLDVYSVEVYVNASESVIDTILENQNVTDEDTITVNVDATDIDATLVTIEDSLIGTITGVAFEYAGSVYVFSNTGQFDFSDQEFVSVAVDTFTTELEDATIFDIDML